MNRTLADVLSGIAADDADALLGASELLRAHCFGVEAGVLEPWASAYAANPLSASDVSALKAVLVRYLGTEPTANVSAALHALGQLQDPTLVPFLRECLVKHLKRCIGQSVVVGQLICALTDSGERVVTGNSYSVNDVNKNIDDARKYLSAVGVTIPWG